VENPSSQALPHALQHASPPFSLHFAHFSSQVSRKFLLSLFNWNTFNQSCIFCSSFAQLLKAIEGYWSISVILCIVSASGRSARALLATVAFSEVWVSCGISVGHCFLRANAKNMIGVALRLMIL